MVQGLRLYLERDCSLTVESFDSALNLYCYQKSESTISTSQPQNFLNDSMVTTNGWQRSNGLSIGAIIGIALIPLGAIFVACVLLVILGIYKVPTHYQGRQTRNKVRCHVKVSGETVCECSNRDTHCAEEAINQPHPASDREIPSDNDNPIIFNYFTITADIT